MSRESDLRDWLAANYPDVVVRKNMTYRELMRIVQQQSGGLPSAAGIVSDSIKDPRIFANANNPTTSTTTSVAAADISIGTISTLAAGSNASAAISDGILNLGIPQGSQGATGAAGSAGAQGNQGLQGDAGIDGSDGSNGAAGAQGIAGNNGADGADGSDGAQGIQGIQGTQGVAGSDGSDGATGAVGAQGIQGVAGTDGTDGTNGSDGATGSTGPTGPQGIQGVAGNNGADGADGATGSAGAAGPAGSQGIQGVAGTDGSDGAAGAAGATGSAGAAGSNGADGADGADGSQGIQGIQGATGAAGSTGSTGSTGAAGADADTYVTHGTQHNDLAATWWTIAIVKGRDIGANQRAMAQFYVRDTDSGRHRAARIEVGHHYGRDGGNQINLLSVSGYGGGVPFTQFRLKEGNTYDGCALQMWVVNPTNRIDIHMMFNFQTGNGWTLLNAFLDDGDVGGHDALLGFRPTGLPSPNQGGDYIDWTQSMTQKVLLDLEELTLPTGGGGIATTGSMVAQLDFKAGGGLILVDKSANSVGFFGAGSVVQQTAPAPINLVNPPIVPAVDPAFDPELAARLTEIENTLNALTTALTNLGLIA
tara:strand:- start:6299 stop:8077 length:1779 start_codon:yes stop_codon:yes gene_type:complete